MSERELIEGLARLAAPVVPGEDPYGRLMRRHRRSRRTKAGGWATAAVLAVVAGLFGPIGIQGAATPVLGGPSGSGSMGAPDWGLPMSPWMRRLIDSPVRGGLASDTAFITELTGLLQRHDVGALPNGQVKILFADDVEHRRVVVAVRFDELWQTGIVLTARRGASPQELDSADDRRESSDEPALERFELQPYFGLTVGRTEIGVAPAGCRIASADSRADTVTWVDEPAGDYMRSEQAWLWQRVTCDGKVQFQGSAPAGLGTGTGRTVSEEEMVAGLAGARGDVDVAVARTNLAASSNEETTGPPQLLFMGRPPGGHLPLTYSVIKVPERGGWWNVYCWADSNLGGSSQATSADLGRPDTVFGVTLTFPSPSENAFGPTPDQVQRWPVLLVAPPTATTVQVRDEKGTLVDTVALTEGVGTTLQQMDINLNLRALDATGAVVATGNYPLPTKPVKIVSIDDWT